jgi:hypothetical protein
MGRWSLQWLTNTSRIRSAEGGVRQAHSPNSRRCTMSAPAGVRHDPPRDCWEEEFVTAACAILASHAGIFRFAGSYISRLSVRMRSRRSAGLH